MSFVTESLSRVGGREHNEDSYGFLEMNQAACWVVADGLGGHRGGETASRIAVDAVLASFRAVPEFSAAALQRHLEAAQQAILKAQKDQPSLSTMRTTIVILLTDSQRALWAHVGDSRLYCVENGHIAFTTKDHSVVQAMVSAGELPASRIRHHEDRNRLLRCLGNSENDFRPTILPEAWPLHRGTAFLLCTDGFWENVTEPEMEVDFAKGEVPEWVASMEGRLLERSTESSDNYTAIAVRFDSETAPVAGAGVTEMATTAVEKTSSGSRSRLARVGFLIALVIMLIVLKMEIGRQLSGLEKQVQDLTTERDKLQRGTDNQQETLAGLRKQLAECENKNASGAAAAAPVPKHTHSRR